MVSAQDIESAIQQLEVLLDHMKALLEWEQTAQFNPQHDLPPSFQLKPHIDSDLRGLSGLFWQIAGSAKELAQDPSFRMAERRRFIRAVDQLQDQLTDLNLSERFKNS